MMESVCEKKGSGALRDVNVNLYFEVIQNRVWRDSDSDTEDEVEDRALLHAEGR
jgi:hypothetical protein